jgi:hypothetical protein
MPPAAAVICVLPALTPVARPLLLIVATPVALLAQVKVNPIIVFPPLSLAVAVNCCVAFAAIDGEVGATVIVATTGAVTVRVSLPLVTPPVAAVICVVPALTPAAKPLLLIVATPVTLLAQVKVTPLITCPLLSSAIAVNCCVPKTPMDGVAGVTVMVATVAGGFDPPPPPQLERRPLVTMDNPRSRAIKAPCFRENLGTKSIRFMITSIKHRFVVLKLAPH